MAQSNAVVAVRSTSGKSAATSSLPSAKSKLLRAISVQIEASQGSYIPWAGAKSWSFKALRKFIPQGAKRLVFACSGAGADAVAYGGLGLPMVMADLNPDVINAHKWVAKNPANAIQQLGQLFTLANNSPAQYSVLREEFNKTAKNTPRRAALFIYLIWHTTKGLCRYNQKGQFNAAFGGRHQGKKAVAVPADAIQRFATAMANASFTIQSLLESLSNAQAGDVVIIDPPYLPAEDAESCHTSYTATGFSLEDHRAMVSAIKAATGRGVMVISHDHLTRTTKALHAGASQIQPVDVPRRISKERATVAEGVFIYEPVSASRFNAHGVLTQPDERLTFKSKTGKSTAEIQIALIDGKWLAEFRYRLLCGDYAACTLPISRHSKQMAAKDEAIADAAGRLLSDVRAKCPNPESLPKVEQAELAELTAWVESLLLANPLPKPLPLSGKKFIDLFSGIGGFHEALKRQGAVCVAACERDKAARETYRQNFGSAIPIYEDIRTLDPSTLMAYDILCGGFPCQSFSKAGNEEGFAAEDKGPLFFEIVRIAAATKPALIILENVAAFANHDKGNTATQAMDALAEIGYAVSMKVLDASEFGVPQQRERLFIVAHRIDLFRPHGNPFGFPVGANPSKVMADILEQAITADRCTAKMIKLPSPATPKASGPKVVGLINGKNNQGYRVMSPQGKGATLCANSGGPGAKTGLYLVNGKPRRLTPRECARMQGFPESFIPNASATQARKQFGNSVAVPVVAAIAEVAARFL